MPTQPADPLDELVTPEQFAAALEHTPTHPQILAAARGHGQHYDALHYAIKDGDATILDAATKLALADPSTWEVLVPAVTSAPAATAAHHRALAGALHSSRTAVDLLADILDALEQHH